MWKSNTFVHGSHFYLSWKLRNKFLIKNLNLAPDWADPHPEWFTYIINIITKTRSKAEYVPDILESVQIILESSTMKLNHVELYSHKSKEATTNLI